MSGEDAVKGGGVPSVLFTSLWEWTPETWGTVGWSGDRGLAHRTKLLKELPDPFICVCYVISNRTETDPDLKGMIGGFYLISHETGNRNEFTHPIHHDLYPDKWRYSLRAVRAFSYLPEYRRRASEVFPDLIPRTARHVSAMGKIIYDPLKIDTLLSIPWIEVPVFSSRTNEITLTEPEGVGVGLVPAGPASSSGYTVTEGNQHLPRELYVLRLHGDTSAFIGRPAEDAAIYKIGLSVSPDFRRQTLQKSIPRSAFRWQVHRSTRKDGHARYSGFSAAVAGEYAMKEYLAKNAEHLGGEFYLASEHHIAAAWDCGRQAALSSQAEGSGNADG